MSKSTTDRIEQQVLLRAPRTRVWRALTDPEQFGQWFGVELRDAKFVPGARVRGPVTHPDYRHLTWEVTIERMEPERLFSWRWHPAIDPGHDYATEPTTLVAFELEDAPGGTLLKVVESGFDRIPPSRRAEAYRGNEGGWTHQMESIAGYVRQAA